MMKKRKSYYIFIIVVMTLISVSGLTRAMGEDMELKVDLKIEREQEFNIDVTPLMLPVNDVKGIYISGWAAGDKNKITELLNFVDNSILNAVVLDIKDERGDVSYNTDVKLATEIGSDKNKIKDINNLLIELHKRNIYVIGRVVVFKDPLLAVKKPDLALKLHSAKDNVTYNSENWVDPAHREVRKYNIELAREAIELGFDEIQFDYIRYPALANKPIVAVLNDSRPKGQLINGFLQEASDELGEFNRPLSIDVFGLTTSVNNDMGIGQELVELAKIIDIISPMVYPSHYSDGVYGLDSPDREPYRTVYRSLKDGLEKIKGQNGVRIRPWLQDFTLNHSYNQEEILAQIRAVNDLGIDEWLFWNPRSNYTIEALMPFRPESER